jgi:hypothetical protein
MTTGFSLQTQGLQNAAAALAAHADLAATAGLRLVDLNATLIAPCFGGNLDAVLTRFSAVWTAALDDVMLSMIELGRLAQQSLSLYLATDDEAAYRFGSVHR